MKESIKDVKNELGDVKQSINVLTELVREIKKNEKEWVKLGGNNFLINNI